MGKKNKKFNFQMADQIVMLNFAEYSLQVSLIWLKTVAWTSILWQTDTSQSSGEFLLLPFWISLDVSFLCWKQKILFQVKINGIL